jgi:hypothetical protein
MAAKTIIFKNAIAETITIESLGLTILTGEVSDIEYEEILILEDSQELVDLINAGVVVVSDGVQDLTSLEALDYLQIGSEFIANYYNKQETDQIINNIVVNNITNIENQLVEDYYTRDEVEELVAGIDASGIKGAVDFFEDLPTENQEGDIYIVRSTSGTGLDSVKFSVDGKTGLYIPADETWEDQLGHSGQAYSSMDPVDGGKIDKALDFDGNNDYLKFYSSSDFGEGPFLTVGGWIYSRRTGHYGIIGRWDNEGDGKGWKIDVHGNKLRVSMDTYYWCGVQFTSPNNLPTNQWVHVAFVYDGYYVTMYQNAVPVNSVRMEGEQIDSHNLDLYIGKYVPANGDDDDDDSQDKYFDGLMDEVFVENRVMTREELEQLIFTELSEYHDEGFYKWDGTEWKFLAHNTGESGATVSHNSLLNINSGDYQHLTVEQKSELLGGDDTEVHKHDSLYYKKSEIDLNKADKNHAHSDLYYGKSEVDSIINGINFSDISSNDSTTNVTGAELEQLTNGGNADGLHTHENMGGSGSGGLDEAYDNHQQYNQGQGRNINVDAGSIQFTASNGFAPLKLTEINYTPNQWLGGGEMCFRDGELFIYDASRAKWLASHMAHFVLGRSGNDRYGYMRVGGEIQTGSSYGGMIYPWDGTIIAISCSSKNNTSGSFWIMKNGSGTDRFYWGGQSENSWSNLNIDFNKNDRITIYQNDDDKPDYPSYTIYVRRRIV